MMSPHVEQVVLKALAKRPDMRYPTMDEFMRAMSDPVGYVEAHGGVTGFAGAQLTPSSAPLPPVRLTPPPMTGITPIPGIHSPVPGTLTAPSPTTLSSAAGQVQPTRSKTPFVIAAALVIALTAGGVFLVLNKKSSASSGNEVANGSDTVVTMGSETKPETKGSAVVPENTGSATAQGSATMPENKGSAAVPETKGSAAVPENKGSAAVPENKGSAAVPEHKGSAAVPENKGSATEMVTVTGALTLSSNPPGADIYINSKSTGKKTPATLTLPRADYKITLRMKGFDDFRKTVSLKQDTVTFDAPLKKATATGKGSASGTSKQCDTCLERPD
ncbi:MAG: PEGA domain-containing protein [Kofleriaceae bacterium]|nr:PEGA domain-containing protein [Kofleriaceae bacterium]